MTEIEEDSDDNLPEEGGWVKERRRERKKKKLRVKGVCVIFLPQGGTQKHSLKLSEVEDYAKVKGICC